MVMCCPVCGAELNTPQPVIDDLNNVISSNPQQAMDLLADLISAMEGRHCNPQLLEA